MIQMLSGLRGSGIGSSPREGDGVMMRARHREGELAMGSHQLRTLIRTSKITLPLVTSEASKSKWCF